MKKHHKSYDYIFTEKNHSHRGMVALALGIFSLLLGIAVVWISFVKKGKGAVWLGSGGILALLAAVAALVLAVDSLREEKSYKRFPIAATAVSGVALAGWVAVYLAGIFG